MLQSNEELLTLNDLKNETMRVCRLKGWDKTNTEDIWLFLIEEIGELASAIRRATNKYNDRKRINVEGEIMDVLSYVFQIADQFDIDLDKAWKNHTLQHDK
jgi:NTP pyrophosphatase (non-canonical NTP hydrolase)